MRVKSGSFFERGGLPALHGGGGSVDATFSTLWVRASTHAFAGSIPFTISGVPLAKNVAVLEAGVETQLRPNLKLGAAYSGQFGGGLKDHGFKAILNWTF